ncbi:presequence protease, mitochondrial-like isoform X2 [Gigantopelta aegis]|nr:presequence protease, mitochondrial-like isoform X2 [Gigantopelta aegis]
MKGVFSSSHDLFAQAAHNSLLPSHTYGVVSGGDPAHIPNLTWEQLKDFHQTHYHPSNSRFFTYGSFPLDEHLKFINEKYLQHFKQISVNTAVPLEPRWPKPKLSEVTCPPDPMAPDPQKQTTVAVSFLLQNITDTFEAFTMSIIGDLLVNGETAPFYRSLLEANIGSGYSPVLGYDGHTKEATFSVGLQGIKEEDVDKVRQIINETFNTVIQEGFEQKRIDAVLHKIELSLKHQTGNFGLALAVGAISTWIHDGDPSQLLQINKHVQMFQTKLKENPRFLQEKVQQYFEENCHNLTLTMKPDGEYEKKRQTGEEERLANLVTKLSDIDREQIYTRGQELMKQQMSTEDFSCLPTLRLSDLDPKIKPEVVKTTDFNGLPVMYSAQPTNEVTYVGFVSSIDDVPSHLKMYVPLFCSIITKMGAGPYDFKSLSQEMDLYTGGLSAAPHLSPHLATPNEYEQGVFFRSNCLEQNTEKMLNLWSHIFKSPDFSDTNRLKTLVQMHASELANSLAAAGHSYAMTHAASCLNAVSHARENFSGISQVSFMKKIAESSDLTELVSHLQEISKHLLNKNRLRLMVNATPEAMDSMLSMVDKFSRDLPGSPAVPDGFQYTQEKSFTPTVSKTQFELPFSVNYMSKSFPSVPYSHPDFPVLKVLGNLLSRKFLHREIREKGGAYGSGATNSGGCFSFFSYRDPRSLQTLEVFDEAISWAANGDFTTTDVDEAKLGVFQQTDRPVPPGKVGRLLFLEHITDDMRQTSRDKLFTVSQGDLKDVTERYLLKSTGPTGVSFLGPANEAVQKDSTWKVLKE